MGKIPWSQVEKMSYPFFANINKPFQKQNRYSSIIWNENSKSVFY